MPWEQRNTVGADRVEELYELYRSLGFKVKIEPFTVPADDEVVCEECYGNKAGTYYVIYTTKSDE